MSALLPPEALRNHVAVLGKTGSGKTSTAKRLVEEVVAVGARVCILDPLKSDWRGLVSSADGQSAGLPFVILGGPFGALPLAAKSGAALGCMVGDGRLPLSILDLSDFGQADHHRFFAAFAEALFRSMTGVLYLVLEEAHEFAPKERLGGEETHSIHWAKKLAAAGRSKGLRLIVCTQRVQKLHNDLLGSCETVFAHRFGAPADQEPILKWVKANADKATADCVGSDLARMPTGEAWIISGEAGLAERRRIPKFETFDNAATPDGAAGVTSVVAAAVDVAALKEALGNALVEAEGNDPKRLRAEIVVLKRNLAEHDGSTHIHPGEVARAFDAGVARERSAVDLRVAETLQAVTESFDQLDEMICAALRETADAISAAGSALRRDVSSRNPAMIGLAPASIDAPATKPRHAPKARRPIETAPVANAIRAADHTATDLTGPERRVLDALAWWAALGRKAPSRAMTGVAAEYAPGSGNFGNILGALNRRALITYPEPGLVALTQAGAAMARAPQAGGTPLESAQRFLSAPGWRVLEAVAAIATAKDASREAVADRAGYAAGSGNFGNLLGLLRTLTMIDYPAPGRVRLAEWLR